MSQAAAAFAGAETEQNWGNEPFLDESELEAAFAAFGARGTKAALKMAPGQARAETRRTFPAPGRRALRFEPGLAGAALGALDWFIIICAAEFAALWGLGESLTELSLAGAAPFLAAGLMLKAGLWLTDAYRVSPGDIHPEQGAGGLAIGAVAAVAIAALATPEPRAAAALATALPAAAVLLAGAHAALALWARAAHQAGAFTENIVVVGANDAARRLIARTRESGRARVVAVVDDRLGRSPMEIEGAPVSGTIEDLIHWEGLPRIDRIVVAVTQKSEARMRAIIARLMRAPNRVDLLLDYPVEGGRGIEHAAGTGLARVSGRTRHVMGAALKRSFDIAVASALIVLLAPVLALAALAVKLDGKGPIFSRQSYAGLNNRPFDMLSFNLQWRDGRLSAISTLLRLTNLDALARLFNVVRGDLSLVGPRAHAADLQVIGAPPYAIADNYARRHWMRPGLTGWAQVHGVAGPLEAPAQFRAEIALDLEYVARASFWLDVSILTRTPLAWVKCAISGGR